ncbi:sodium solute symporter [Aureococcus anophagefferens]|nr:sodium solute symporter [Aureococcus anophagefferens]
MVNWETCVTDPTDSSGTPYLTHMPREYFGEDSFFGGKAPLSQASGWIIVVGMGVGMTLLAVLLTYLEVTFNRSGKVSSEFFNTAGRSVKTGLTASVLLFGILAIEIKRKCPTAHTMVEIVRARWPGAHYTFLFFGFSANLIVTSMLILGGAATINALCGMHTIIASFLIPISVIPYTMYGGLKSTLASYIHTPIIFAVLLMMIYTIYVSKFSSDLIWEMLKKTTFNPDAADPADIFPELFLYAEEDGDLTDCLEDDPPTCTKLFACGGVDGNAGVDADSGSYLTMISLQGLMFGVINIVGNFGTVFCDQSYWQSAIAAKPAAAHKGYMLGGMVWFAIPSSPRDRRVVAVSYDVYKPFFNPACTGEDIVRISRIVIPLYCCFSGVLATCLWYIGIGLGWVYGFMGIHIGCAVVPVWWCLTNPLISEKGAIAGAWSGCVAGSSAWLATAAALGDPLDKDGLGTLESMLAGNVCSIVVSGMVCYAISAMNPQNYDFKSMKAIELLDNDQSGLDPDELSEAKLLPALNWIKKFGWGVSFVLCVLWPALSTPAGTFSKTYFSFWIFIVIAWGFFASVVIIGLPIVESWEDISTITKALTGVNVGLPETNLHEKAAKEESA